MPQPPLAHPMPPGPNRRYVLLVLDNRAGSVVSLTRRAIAERGLVAEAVMCGSADEAVARLRAGRRYSAVLAHSCCLGIEGVSAAARRHATPLIVVGADPGPCSPASLCLAVRTRTVAVRRADYLGAVDLAPTTAGSGGRRGHLVAVCGAGGAGTSVIAATLAGGLAGGPAGTPGTPAEVEGGPAEVEGGPAEVEGGPAEVGGGPAEVGGGPAEVEGGPAEVGGGPAEVEGGPAEVGGGPAEVGGGPAGHATGRRLLLADFALHSDQAMLHGLPDTTAGLLDLTALFRYRCPGLYQVRAIPVDVGHYRLLTGLRRPAQWVAVSPPTFDAARYRGLVAAFGWLSLM